MGSVRDRIEQADIARKYNERQSVPTASVDFSQTRSVRERLDIASRAKQPEKLISPAEQVEAQRRERLAQNARTIRENQVNNLLLNMSDAERECVFTIVGRERPDALGSSTVIEATLLRVREEGTANLREVMQDTTREEQQKVWQKLGNASAEEKLGMDGGRACAKALRQVRDEEYLGGE